MTLPSKVFINAFTGETDKGSALHDQFGKWVQGSVIDTAGDLKPRALPDHSKWQDRRVGWGLVLPDPPDPTITAEQRATAFDAPTPIRQLVEKRNGSVFRWSPSIAKGKLRTYQENTQGADLDIVMSQTGLGKNKIPHYLLMFGTPSELPWRLQYDLSASKLVGRLDIRGAALERYVDALTNQWSESKFNANNIVIWAVDHGSPDITHLMRGAVGVRLNNKLIEDDDIDTVFFDGHKSIATCAKLIDALRENKPGLIVTSSHGMTGPLNDLEKMRDQLGLPVDGLHKNLNIKELIQTWQPDGAIWHAQACCSAGSDGESSYIGLVSETSFAHEVIQGVTKLGSMVAPLPRALLGAEKPLRAFIGHVEPTFDWTLRDQDTRQIYSHSLLEAMYDRLYQPLPIARAYEEVRAQGAQLNDIHRNAINQLSQGQDTIGRALAAKLVAQDLRSLIVLGDPTVILP